MPEVKKTQWWSGMLTIQSAMALGGAIVSICFFIFRTNLNDKDIAQLKKDMVTKADRAETEAKIRSTDDKVNRQYENNNKITDRIILIEKQREYDRGVQDGQKK